MYPMTEFDRRLLSSNFADDTLNQFKLRSPILDREVSKTSHCSLENKTKQSNPSKNPQPEDLCIYSRFL